MKKLVILLAIVTSTMALADCKGEAQVIGKVKNLITTSQDYSFQISLKAPNSYIRINELCPLLSEEVEAATITVQGNTEMKEGDVVSGVVSINPETFALELH